MCKVTTFFDSLFTDTNRLYYFIKTQLISTLSEHIAIEKRGLHIRFIKINTICKDPHFD